MDNAMLRKATDRLIDSFGALVPSCAVIAGSGWSEAMPDMSVLRSVSYADIPCLGSPNVPGHPGTIRLAEFAGGRLLLFMGRRHWYEGCGWEPVAFPVFLCARLHVPVLLITNAAGGIRDDLQPGHLMVVDDHINAMGASPLAGERDPVWGERFTDQSQVYDLRLNALLDDSARTAARSVSHGVYVGVSGPAYETPAEIRAFRLLGADAIGMSTVPEATLARAAGLRVAAVSCITNRASSIGGPALAHDDVVAAARDAQPGMRRLLASFLTRVAEEAGRA